jgi:hypothetical protein
MSTCTKNVLTTKIKFKKSEIAPSRYVPVTDGDMIPTRLSAPESTDSSTVDAVLEQQKEIE